METIAERIIKVVDHTGGNKSEFARRLNVTPAYISKFGKQPDSKPSEIVIKSICREFDVNETWLRTGEGEMFLPKSLDDELAEFMGSVLREDIRTSVKKQIIDLLAHIPPEMWDGIAEVAQQRAAQYKNDLPPNDEEGR